MCRHWCEHRCEHRCGALEDNFLDRGRSLRCLSAAPNRLACLKASGLPCLPSPLKSTGRQTFELHVLDCVWVLGIQTQVPRLGQL